MRPMRGFTLVEILVGLVIGLLVALAGMASYLNAADNAREIREQVELTAEASAVLREFERQARLAGYSSLRYLSARNALESRAMEPAPLRACDGGFDDPQAAEPRCNGGDGGDAVELVHEADSNTSRHSVGQVYDCSGELVPLTAKPDDAILVGRSATAAGYYQVRSRFYWRAAASGAGELVCAGNGGAFSKPVVLLTNVEDWQLQFSFIPAAGGSPVLGTATEVAGAYASEAQGWQAVQGIHLCLVLRSQQHRSGVPIAYTDCHGKAQTPTDGFPRRRVQAVVTLRNRLAS